MRKQRRELQEANVSFLDVISCGFGAIVLLLIIAPVGDPSALDEADNQMMGSVKEYQERLFEIRDESMVLNNRLKSRQDQLSELTDRIARLKEKLASVSEQPSQRSLFLSREKEQLQLAQQILSEEVQRLLGENFKPRNDLVFGIPADSRYIIFVIDTSPSMVDNAWGKVKKEMNNILDIYPEVKGIQVLNSNGKYMFANTSKQWMSDSPAMRKNIIKTLDSWAAFSDSNPVEGINIAIQTFYQPGRKISIYMLGDDFDSDGSVRGVVKTVDQLNKANRDDDRLVRIHAIGFPVAFSKGYNIDIIKFSALWRELSYNNGGVFIGLNSLN